MSGGITNLNLCGLGSNVTLNTVTQVWDMKILRVTNGVELDQAAIGSRVRIVRCRRRGLVGAELGEQDAEFQEEEETEGRELRMHHERRN
mmetsp:Transcript_14191/g.23193  ORF Transcript_14191/g.23193 Transcript_14191/m.23193 type:complete len:90 (+) Transcript_14191:1010-1279(+)